jgi:transcriptional regulator NrdR family protein
MVDGRRRMDGSVRRRRECPKGHRFTTIEVLAE